MPLPSLSVPEKVVVVLLLPVVSVTDPATVLVTKPDPPAASRSSRRSRPGRTCLLEATVTALLAPMPLAIPSLSVPLLIVVAPVYVWATPNVSVPVPSLVRPPVPEMAPADLLVLPAPSRSA